MSTANVPSTKKDDPRFLLITDAREDVPEVGDEIFRYSSSIKAYISYIVENIETKKYKNGDNFYEIKFRGDKQIYECYLVDGKLIMYMNGHGMYSLYKYNNAYVRVRGGIGHYENRKGHITGGRRTLRKSHKRRGKSQKRR